MTICYWPKTDFNGKQRQWWWWFVIFLCLLIIESDLTKCMTLELDRSRALGQCRRRKKAVDIKIYEKLRYRDHNHLCYSYSIFVEYLIRFYVSRHFNLKSKSRFSLIVKKKRVKSHINQLDLYSLLSLSLFLHKRFVRWTNLVSFTFTNFSVHQIFKGHTASKTTVAITVSLSCTIYFNRNLLREKAPNVI